MEIIVEIIQKNLPSKYACKFGEVNGVRPCKQHEEADADTEMIKKAFDEIWDSKAGEQND